jgi:hypothetical protein
MQRSAPIRLLAVAALTVSALSLAAQATPAPATKPSTATTSTLPATQPTTPQPTAAPLPPPTPAQLPPSHAEITYTGGALFVAASNSSLNQILREISRETGINISGGVADERVFGQYGPDSPAQILSALLDGTGSNMLLVQGDGNTPAELVLTPRQGGPTPPNPNAHAFDDAPEPRTISNADPSDSQPAEQPPPSKVQPSAGVPVTPETPAAAATDSTQPQSPNGVKTPQQIYDQLQKLRQQPPGTPPQ